MTVINTNVGALQARTYAVKADSNVTRAMERLSSGLRINSAADDAAGLAVANKMESQIRGMNMAIRNSQDGISLVQTAESAMGEINNMVIRMRELAVQMNNGVYTDADRSNAQLEVTALLAEIDKVAANSAFNQVKILDGTYSQDIRAGNTNPEVINVTIDRMNTDSLGGGRVTTGVAAATLATVGDAPNATGAGSNRAKHFKTDVTVQEGRPVISLASLGTGGTAGTVSLITNPNSKFAISGDGLSVTLNAKADGSNSELNFDAVTAANNVHSFTLQYDNGGVITTEDVTVTITDEPVATTGISSASTMTVEESACVKIQAGSELSDQVNEFIAAAGLAGSTIEYGLAEVAGQDDVAKGKFSINSGTGEILASLDFERPTGGAGDNSNTYTFDVTVRNTATNQTMTETITLNVTDFDGTSNNVVDTDEAVWAAASADVANGTTPDVTYSGTAFQAVTAETNDLAITFDTAGAATVATALSDISQGLAAFAAVHTDADTNGFQVISIDGTDVSHTTGAHTISTGVSLNVNGSLTIASTSSATTVDNVHIRYTADNGRVFDVFTDITITSGGALAIAESNATAAGNDSTVDVTAGGEAATLDLKAGGTAGDGVFDGISNFYALNPCGIFTVENAQFNGAASTDISVDNSGVLTLAAGAAAGTYTADVYYEDNEGDSYVQRVNLVVTEVGIRGENGNGAAADKTAVATAHDTEAPSSYESTQVRGVSTINIAEARQGTIKSVGSGAVLSSAMNTFVNTDYPGGSFALSGTDASLFTVDASTGDISTIGLVDYESKTSYDFSVTYTNGSNSYTEEITLRVGDDNVDNTTHIIDVNLGTQAGSASAVTILDNAINQISSSQAKLGAIQNRLQYNIDNLSKATMLTQTAKGRIVDADFAAETSELSKQQILSQAATSMLAQANQSKQSVLALLQ
jgi:flagellin